MIQISHKYHNSYKRNIVIIVYNPKDFTRTSLGDIGENKDESIY